MIIAFRLNDICCDWEQPHFFSSETNEQVFLTPEQSCLLPIHKFKFEYIFHSEYSPEQNLDTQITFSFDATKISEFFRPLLILSILRNKTSTLRLRFHSMLQKSASFFDPFAGFRISSISACVLLLWVLITVWGQAVL